VTLNLGGEAIECRRDVGGVVALRVGHLDASWDEVRIAGLKQRGAVCWRRL
jgi:hypothetical protein